MIDSAASSLENRAMATVAVVGAGAVGGYYGARLAQAGHDVRFLLRRDLDAGSIPLAKGPSPFPCVP